MTVDITSSSLVACICEGGAETAIMDILLDHDRLIFNREQLLEGQVLPRISVRDFERRYLGREYDRKVLILRVIDSRKEQFNLSEAYRCQVERIINARTSPEIEMLIIVREDRYDNYCHEHNKNKIKPSEYCKTILGHKKVKTQEFIREYFSNPDVLIDSIIKYHGLHKQENDEAALYDLLKDEYRNL